MSDALPPPSPPSSSRSAAVAAACWVVILASTAYLIALQATLADLPRPAPDDPAQQHSPQLRLMGKYALGMRGLLGSSQRDQFQRQLDELADNAADRLRIIPLIGELIGRDEALAALRRFEASHPAPAWQADASALRAIYTSGPQSLDERAQARLVRRHGWFAEVALVWGLADQDPQRKALLGSARRLLVGMMAAGGAGILVLLAGLTLMVLGIVWWALGRLRLAMEPATAPTAMLEAFAVYLFGFVLVSLLGLWAGRRLSMVGTVLMLLVVPLAVAWPLLRGVSWAQLRQSLGRHRGRGVLREIGCGVVGYLAGTPLLVLSMLVTLALVTITGKRPSHPIEHEVTGAWLNTLWLVAMVCVWAPLTEETLFRGAFLGHLARIGFWPAAILSSLIFALIHPQGWLALPPLATVAMVFAMLRRWRGSLIAPVVAHALHNGIAVIALVVLMG